MGTRIGLAWVAVSTMGFLACTPRHAADVVEPEAPGSSASVDPGTSFSELERRLLGEPFAMRFEVEAEGAVRVSLAGQLRVGSRVLLRAEGEFAGQRQDLHLWTEGDRLLAGPPDAPLIDQPRPPDLEAALILGLTRMGVLHNLAMLSGGAPPDHAEAWDDRWVEALDQHRPTPPPEHGEALGFSLRVAGQPSGQAVLWLDDDGVPLRREQVVDFPEGQMRVQERYEVLESALASPPGAG